MQSQSRENQISKSNVLQMLLSMAARPEVAGYGRLYAEIVGSNPA
jgi:hypothetical protein